ncbi:hypothetical protein BC834DRAFT_971263 [Gloeopeniophorella convolvens]|nr:hypothetical protein BC834DRAFT_971263 [Gloeopeniophorella convolvens]
MAPISYPAKARNTRTRGPILGLNVDGLGTAFDSTRPVSLSSVERAVASERVENATKHKLSTYQAAAVVSTVLAGLESQLLIFFKTSFNPAQSPKQNILSLMIALTYIALIFSVSATISSLVLTENFGDVPRMVARLRERLRSGAAPSPTTFGDQIAPRRWRWMEWHWLFTLVVSVLSLLVQIMLYIWLQEKNAMKVTISIASVFGMLPLLHFLPLHWEDIAFGGHADSPPTPASMRNWSGIPMPAPGDTVTPAGVVVPPAPTHPW